MDAGFGLSEINAPVGTIMDGQRTQGGTTGVHDPLFVRALWLRHGGAQAAVVAFDLLFAERDLTDRLKGAAGRALGLRAEELLLNFSHTHSAPCFCRWAYGGPPDPAYVDKVEAAMIAALRRAREAARPARPFAGMAQSRLPVSRRRPNAQGKIEFKPNLDGPVLSALPFCLLKDDAGKVAALLFSVSCHPSSIFSHDITADFPGPAVAALNRHFATEGAIFLQGCGGDAKPRTNLAGDKWRHTEWADVEAAGRQVAAEVIARAGDAREVTPELRATLTEIEFPLTPAPDRNALECVNNLRQTPWAADMLHRLDFLGRLPDRAPVLLHALQLGRGLRLIGLEAETTAPIGALLLRAFPEGVTFPLGYTDGMQLYLPDDRQLAEGGYEAESAWEYHWPAPLAAGIDARLTEALERLKAQGF
jgi:hypothetical protein